MFNVLWQVVKRFINLTGLGFFAIVIIPFAVVGLTIEKLLRELHIIKRRWK